LVDEDVAYSKSVKTLKSRNRNPSGLRFFFGHFLGNDKSKFKEQTQKKNGITS